METNSSSKNPTTKIDRKTIEKNRRNHMKCLYSQLNSLVHHDASSSKETLTLSDQLDEATSYIKNLKENVSNLRRKKSLLVFDGSNCSSSSSNNNNNNNKRSYSLISPVQIEVQEKEKNAIEVILVTGLECQFVFTEALGIIDEEHADVVNASYSVVGNTAFHSIHAKIREDAIHGVARITERLKKYAL